MTLISTKWAGTGVIPFAKELTRNCVLKSEVLIK